jgi:hypothetical protein
MNDIPSTVANSRLWTRLNDDPELIHALRNLRKTSEKLAATVASSVPDFTDHSIRHMDHLWSVADQVLTPDETTHLTLGEAFLLAVSFYLHDIGMALACNKAGLDEIRASPPYQEFLKRTGFATADATQQRGLEAKAVAYAVRRLHAAAAIKLAGSAIPGTADIFLLEPREIREVWASDAGNIAASHNWSIDEVDKRIGRQGIAPLGNVGSGDRAYIACLLRIIDFAHISRERALFIERALRQPLDPESLVHWLAQEKLVGPTRVEYELVYRSLAPINNVDAWWLYYEMLAGLNDEILSVAAT